MRKILVLLTVLAVLASCGPKEFTFVQMTDPQIGFGEKDVPHYPKSVARFAEAVSETNALRPSAVFITGDLVHSWNNPEQVRLYNEGIAGFSDKAPLWVVAGNHDMRPYNDTTRAEYIERIGYDRFSTVIKGCAFIGFDSNCIKYGDETTAAEQFAWLEKELQDAQKCRHRFLFTHFPVLLESMTDVDEYFNFPAECRSRYVELFNKYNVDAIFSGHTHKSHYAKQGCTEFYNCGPVGHPLNGGVCGYNVVKVTKDGYSVEYVTLDN